MNKMLTVIMGIGLILMTGCEKQEQAACCPASAKKSCCPDGCDGAALKTPKLAIKLDSAYKNPDGMTIKDGEIWLTINNVAQDAPSCIVKITKDDKIEKIIDLPKSAETKTVSALGLVFASDGNLYVSDNQNLGGQGFGKSRVLRVVMKDGKATGVEVVATGLHAANGIAARGDSIFVNETTFGDATPLISGTYQFKLSDLKADAPVKVDGTVKDPHVIFVLKTVGKYPVGANGLCFDSEGKMYVANFGDREIWQVVFDKAGKVAGSKLFTTVECAESVDGMQYDGEGFIWFADFIGCALFKVCTKSGTATMIAKNAACDGVNGELDAPSECIKLGSKVYVANIDLTFGPNTADETYTISVIELD